MNIFPVVNSFKNGFVTHKKSITKYYKKKKLLCISWLAFFRVKVLYYYYQLLRDKLHKKIKTIFNKLDRVLYRYYPGAIPTE